MNAQKLRFLVMERPIGSQCWTIVIIKGIPLVKTMRTRAEHWIEQREAERPGWEYCVGVLTIDDDRRVAT
jgi:hypothetical protein